jgi:hypothetical protein
MNKGYGAAYFPAIRSLQLQEKETIPGKPTAFKYVVYSALEYLNFTQLLQPYFLCLNFITHCHLQEVLTTG